MACLSSFILSRPARLFANRKLEASREECLLGPRMNRLKSHIYSDADLPRNIPKDVISLLGPLSNTTHSKPVEFILPDAKSGFSHNFPLPMRRCICQGKQIHDAVLTNGPWFVCHPQNKSPESPFWAANYGACTSLRGLYAWTWLGPNVIVFVCGGPATP